MFVVVACDFKDFLLMIVLLVEREQVQHASKSQPPLLQGKVQLRRNCLNSVLCRSTFLSSILTQEEALPGIFVHTSAFPPEHFCIGVFPALFAPVA